MMPVNEHLDSFALFTTNHKSKFDITLSITNDNTLLDYVTNEQASSGEAPMNKQSEVPPLGKSRSHDTSTPSPGDTVSAWLDGEWVVAVVEKVNELRHNKTTFRIRLLNSRKGAIMSETSIQ